MVMVSLSICMFVYGGRHAYVRKNLRINVKQSATMKPIPEKKNTTWSCRRCLSRNIHCPLGAPESLVHSRAAIYAKSHMNSREVVHSGYHQHLEVPRGVHMHADRARCRGHSCVSFARARRVRRFAPASIFPAPVVSRSSRA